MAGPESDLRMQLPSLETWRTVVSMALARTGFEAGREGSVRPFAVCKVRLVMNG